MNRVCSCRHDDSIGYPVWIVKRITRYFLISTILRALRDNYPPPLLLKNKLFIMRKD